LIVASFVMPSHRVLAQPAPARIELAGQFAWISPSEFDGDDRGFGGRIGLRFDVVTVEAEVNVYPGQFPGEHGFSRSRLEALFGASAGPRLRRFRPFAKVRPGLVRFRPPSEPLACILIFPPPLSCELARGRTLFAADIGGGVDVLATGGTFVRVDAGDRLVRYPGPVFDSNRKVHDTPFFSHELRVTASAGVRF
jgi:hypothetical protein